MAIDGARGPQADVQRLFVAISIPDRVAATVEAAVGPWRPVLPHARWVPRSNWHVTLRFLGPTSSRLVPWIRERLSQVAATTSPFPSRVRTLGAFPSTRRARVLWTGLDDLDGRLTALASAIQGSIGEELAPLERPFTAHMTVARSDTPLRLPENFSETSLESEIFTVGAFVLMRSDIHRQGSRYEPLGTYPLGGRAVQV